MLYWRCHVKRNEIKQIVETSYRSKHLYRDNPPTVHHHTYLKHVVIKHILWWTILSLILNCMTKKLILSEIIQTLSIKILQFTMRDIHTHTQKKKKKKKMKNVFVLWNYIISNYIHLVFSIQTSKQICKNHYFHDIFLKS